MAEGHAILQEEEVEAIIARRAGRWGWSKGETAFRVAVMVQARQTDKAVGFVTEDLALIDTGEREGLVAINLKKYHSAACGQNKKVASDQQNKETVAAPAPQSTPEKKQAVAKKLKKLKKKEQEKEMISFCDELRGLDLD